MKAKLIKIDPIRTSAQFRCHLGSNIFRRNKFKRCTDETQRPKQCTLEKVNEGKVNKFIATTMMQFCTIFERGMDGGKEVGKWRLHLDEY